MRERDYQLDMRRAAVEAFAEHRSALVVAPTGTGKTVFFGHLAKEWPRERGKVLVIAHRRTLLHQAKDKLERITGESIGLEVAEEKLTNWKVANHRIIVASKDSLHERRITKFDPQAFGLLIIDEAHRAARKNKTYRRVLEHFQLNPEHRTLGVTATPDRGDRARLVGPEKVFETLAYTYPLWDADGKANAIDDGWLVPIRQQYIRVEGLTLSQLVPKNGDFTDADIERVMGEQKRMYEYCSALVRATGDRPTLIFCATIAHAAGAHEPGQPTRQGVVDVLNELVPGQARAVHGKMSREDQTRGIDQFRRGAIRYLVSCDLLIEGYDEPGVACCAILRPTKARSRYAQMVGRGTRPALEIVAPLNGASSAEERRILVAGSAKPDLLVLDFVGLHDLKLTVSVAELLHHGEEDNAVAAQAKRLAAQRPGSDARELMREAQVLVWQKDAARVLAERQCVMDQARAQIVAGVQYQAQAVDPFDRYSVNPPVVQPHVPKRPPSERMVRKLCWLGVREEVARSWSFKRCMAEIGWRERRRQQIQVG